MANAEDFRGQTLIAGGLNLSEQASCPIPSGQSGVWNDGGVMKIRQSDGTDTTIAGGEVGGALRAHAVCTSALAANTYANGTLGVGATLTGNANGAFATIDGVAAALNNLYLVTAEASGENNGYYKLTQLGTAGTPYILTRAEEFDQSAEMKDGTAFVIRAGTVNADTLWRYTAADSPTVGTTSLTFARDPLVVTTNTAQTITGAKDFAAGTLKADNNSTTNAHTFVSAATAARNVTLPDATFTVPQDSLVVHLAGAETITGAKDFAAGTLKADNNNTTNAHTFVSAATAARNVTLPDATFTVPQDSLVVHLAGTETVTGDKTLDGVTTLTKDGTGTGTAAMRFGATATEGLEFVVFDDVISPAAVETNVVNVPANSVILSVQGNCQAALTGGGTTVTWSLGVTADPDKYGTAGNGGGDSLAQNSKADWTATPTRLTSAEQIVLTGAATGGAADGDTALTVGSVRVRVVYATCNSLDNA